MSEQEARPWQLYLFGSPRLASNGQPLVIKLRKALALFVYLAVTRQPHSRDALATLFWPEKDQQSARANLRRTLYDLTQFLKEALGEDLLAVEPETIALRTDLPLWIDTVAFQQTVAAWLPRAAADCSLDEAARAALVQAAELYQADFLEGFTLPDAPAFEEWQFFRRDELRQHYTRLLQQLMQCYEASGDSERAITYARRWLLLDELEERAHRRLMQLYAAAGQQAAALRQYEECTRILQQELDVSPKAETTALYEAIRLRRLPQATPSAPAQSTMQEPRQFEAAPTINAPGTGQWSAAGGTNAVGDEPAPRHPQQKLPTQSTPFIGRSQELQDLLRRLADPACRLLSLVGPGGIGKTRLALAVAQQLMDATDGIEPAETSGPAFSDQTLVQACAAQFSDGIFFVPLQPITTASGLIAAIAEVLNFQFYSGEPLEQQLRHFLHDKALLLVLDNFEQLLDGAAILTELLAGARQLKLLVTTREALKLQEEWFHPLAGLRMPPLITAGTPTHGLSAESFAHYDAVQLFIQTARRVTVNFDPTQHEAQIIRICRLVDGMPLGVELAAAWLKVFTCAQIADEIERGVDILVARHQNVPERHRNMRVVMEQSLALLEEATQQVLQRLAIFHGGFDQAAARAVAGADLMILADLLDKAWIYQPHQGRYQMHELLRQFVGAQSTADPVLTAAVRRAHSAYYLHFLQAQEKALVGKAQLQALERISVEIENVQMAWQWFVQQQDWTATQQILEGIFWFYLMRRRSVEGADLFAQTIIHLAAPLAAQAPPDPALVAFQIILLRRVGIFYYFLGDYTTAQQHLEESLALSRQRADHAAVASALNVLGVINGWQGHGEVAKAQLRECLALANELNDRQTAADAYHELAQILAHSGEFAEAKALTEQGLVLCRRLARPDWLAHALDTLGWITFCMGEYAASVAHYRESLAIFQELGHQLGISLALGGLGLNAWAKGDAHFAEARRLIEESLAICRTIGNRLQMASHLADLAKVLDDVGEHALALRHAQEGLTLAEAVGSPVFIAYNLASMGAALRNLGELESSRVRLRRALASAATAQLLPVQTIVLYEYAVLLHTETVAAVADQAIRRQKDEQALGLLLLVADHPAGLAVYKEHAAGLIVELQRSLPQTSGAAPPGPPREQTLAATVTQILAHGG